MATLDLVILLHSLLILSTGADQRRKKINFRKRNDYKGTLSDKFHSFEETSDGGNFSLFFFGEWVLFFSTGLCDVYNVFIFSLFDCDFG